MTNYLNKLTLETMELTLVCQKINEVPITDDQQGGVDSTKFELLKNDGGFPTLAQARLYRRAKPNGYCVQLRVAEILPYTLEVLYRHLTTKISLKFNYLRLLCLKNETLHVGI
jgi:hypothetical protein